MSDDVKVKGCSFGCMLKIFSIFIFLFLRNGSFTVVGTVSVIFSFVNLSRDIVGFEADEKQIRLCEAIEPSGGSRDYA